MKQVLILLYLHFTPYIEQRVTYEDVLNSAVIIYISSHVIYFHVVLRLEILHTLRTIPLCFLLYCIIKISGTMKEIIKQRDFLTKSNSINSGFLQV